MQSKVTWKQDMAFGGHIDGFELDLDASAEHGGHDRGPRPKGLLLVSLAGCTAMDVVAILAKMRVQPDRFEVGVDGELAAEHPKRFVSIVLRYRFEGEALPPAKLRRAVQLSEERYCGVRASLDPAIALSSEIYVNGERLALDAGDAP